MSGTRSAAPKAPATEPRWRDSALVLGVHGVRGGVGVAAEHAARIREHGCFAEVGAGAHKGEPGLLEALAEVRAERAYLVPLLMAEGYTLRAMVRSLNGPDLGTRLILCRPVGTHPRLAEMTGRKALAARTAQGWAAADSALLLVGHGTERHAASGTTTRRHAAELAARGGFAEVAVAFLDQVPTIADAVARLSTPRCVAVGLFLDRGEHGEQDIPRLLATTGHQTVYAGPIGTDPEIATLIIEQVRERDRLSHAA